MKHNIINVRKLLQLTGGDINITKSSWAAINCEDQNLHDVNIENLAHEKQIIYDALNEYNVKPNLVTAHNLSVLSGHEISLESNEGLSRLPLEIKMKRLKPDDDFRSLGFWVQLSQEKNHMRISYSS